MKNKIKEKKESKMSESILEKYKDLFKILEEYDKTHELPESVKNAGRKFEENKVKQNTKS